MTLRQRAEQMLQTEHVSNAEWKALAREMLEKGLFTDDERDGLTVDQAFQRLEEFVTLIERNNGKVPKPAPWPEAPKE